MRRKRILWIAPLAILGMAFFAWIGGEVVLHLWNWLLPSLFGWRQVTFWQALGLLALCRILFGGFGMRGRGPRHYARQRILERLDKMSPEEREKVCYGLHGRWGREAPHDSKPSI